MSRTGDSGISARPSSALRLLIVEDQPANQRLLVAVFEAEGFETQVVADGNAALSAVRNGQPSAVLMDLHLPDMNGIEALTRLKADNVDIPVVILTAHGDIRTAVNAIKLGAYDFLTRPIDNEKLVLTIKHAIEHRNLTSEVRALRKRIATSDTQKRLLGSSDAIRRVCDQISQVADTQLSVLILGETGTGKELVARAIHQESSRRERAFIALDCGAIPDTLMESELFGYERGAFSGAERRKDGHFALANGGTLFLDEVANLSPTTQAKLLRVLQERKLLPLGATEPKSIDTRVVAATNETLDSQMKDGRFRQDLYYRIAEIIIRVPPLRARIEDVVLLAERFVEEASVELRRSVSGISNGAQKLLREYAWPGNVRQLRNVMRQAVLLSPTTSIEAHDLDRILAGKQAPPYIAAPIAVADNVSLKEVAEAAASEAERHVITEVLRGTRGNKSQAARLLQVDFKTLSTKMKRYGIDRSDNDDLS